MTFDPSISLVLLETVLRRLIPILLDDAGGNRDTARQAAHDMLAGQRPADDIELLLIARTIVLDLKSIDAAVVTMVPGTPEKDLKAAERTSARVDREATRLHTLLHRIRNPSARSRRPAITPSFAKRLRENTLDVLGSRLPEFDPIWDTQPAPAHPR